MSCAGASVSRSFMSLGLSLPIDSMSRAMWISCLILVIVFPIMIMLIVFSDCMMDCAAFLAGI